MKKMIKLETSLEERITNPTIIGKVLKRLSRAASNAGYRLVRT